jgi:hypothetical protein
MLVKPHLARGLGTPSSGVPPRLGAGHPLERGSASLEGGTPPRARARLDRELNAPSSKALSRSRTSRARRLYTCSPGKSILCTDTRRCSGQRRIHATTCLGITPQHCSADSPPLCGMVSNHFVALYHPLPYGRRTAPSKGRHTTSPRPHGTAP